MSICIKVICVISFLFSGMVFAAGNATTAANIDNAPWKTFPKHADLQYAVMAGNPLTNGMFIVWLKLPKNYTDVAHSHTEERYDTIIAGSYFMSLGDKLDKSNARQFVAGDFVKCAANVTHSGFTNDGAVIQITGMGPWEVLKAAGNDR